MAGKAGVPLVELFSTLDRRSSSLPKKIKSFIDRFSVIDHTVSRSPEAIFHFGKVQAIDESLSSIPAEFDIGFGKLSLPLLQTGIPIQLSLLREPVTDSLEPAPTSWRLDLLLDAFVLTLDGLQAATYVEETGTVPQHLLRDPNRSSVRITGHATLRIEQTSSDSSVQFRLIDSPDPLDPLANTGVVASIAVNPPHFFIGGSEFGLSIKQILYDGSEEYTPAEIVERGHSDSWVGLSIREATFYAPRGLPTIGDLSAGVKDVLLGRPMGVQGELEIQFGRTPLDPATFRFVQRSDPDTLLPVSGSGNSRLVEFQGSQNSEIEILAGLTVSGSSGLEWHAIWDWDNGVSDEGDSSSGTVRQGSSLRITPVEVVTTDGDTESFRHPDITFRFQAAGVAPGMQATINGRTLENIVYLGGSKADIEGLSLQAVSGTSSASSQFNWSINGQPVRTSGNTYTLTTPTLEALTGIQYLMLEETITTGTDGQEETRLTRLQIEIRESGDFLIGCEAGVFDASNISSEIEPSAIEATFDLSDFHSTQAFNSSFVQAALQSSSPFVSVPADGLAQVVISEPPAVPVEPPRDRHVQILMDFDTDNELSWGVFAPASATDAFSQLQLLSWAARYPNANFVVVGRCGDLGSVSHNVTLADDRAQRAHRLLTQWSGGSQVSAVTSTQIFIRGEQREFVGANAGGDGFEEDSSIGLSAAEKSEAVTGTSGSGWLIKAEHAEHSDWPRQRTPNDSSENIRKAYRRVDIYAVGGTPQEATIVPDDEQTYAAQHRRVLVPANGRDLASVPTGASEIDYRVKLRAIWDSPVATDIKDAIPTLAEAEFAWTPNELPLPEVNGQTVDISREVLTVFAQWLHDIRTGYTKLTLGIESEGDPDGLFKIENDNLTTALALGPALLSGVDADTDLLEAGAKVTALLAASAFATIEFDDPDNPGTKKQLVSRASKTAIKSITAETEMRSLADPGPDMQIRLLLDYTATLHIFTGALGLQTDQERPLKIRYRRAGLEFDSSKEDWDKVGLAFDSSDMDIEDPGKWEIKGALGSLLRITEVTVGRGSLWFEIRIAVGLSIGIIEISEAVVRLTWSGLSDDPIPDFSLRGLVLKADIPNTLKGEGRIRIEDSGVLRAGIKCDIIPVGLGAEAAIALSQETEPEPYTFLSLFLSVQFSTPLPLAQSGIAIYGFSGMFGMNAQRKLANDPDPIKKELDWFAEPPENKYEPKLGQYALGVGAVVGTMPDVSFCFSCEGMVFVGFPDPEVIFGVKVKIVEVPDLSVKDQGSASSAAITGLIVIDDEAVKVGVIAEYEIPKVLHLKVPFSAYFPYPGSDKDVYVRIGSDGIEGRLGDPVTVTLLPDTLDVSAWSYLMIEEGGLPRLGGDSRFNFEGFSVGFGAGWGINWSAGPIKLSASAKVLVGFGTAPLIIKGGVFVAGELSLVVVSISARGELILEIRDDYVRLDGEFCGKVDLFFFDIEGCVGVSIGDEPNLSCPDAPSPIGSIGLTDRRDRVMGMTTSGVPKGRAIFDADNPSAGVDVDHNNKVWPDTAPVIHFKHYIENGMGGSAQFTPGSTPCQPKWTGSSELKFAYRLNNILLRNRGGSELVSGAKSLQSVWTTTPYRQPDCSAANVNPAPSEHEGPTLKLLDWEPWNWAVNMDDGGESQQGDPAETVGRVCDPLPFPSHACLYGRSVRRAGLHRMKLYPEAPAQPPYPSHFKATGFAYFPASSTPITGRDLQVLIERVGGILETGQVQPLPLTHVSATGESINSAYCLPNARITRNEQIVDMHLPYQLRIDRQITRPVVTLMVCDRPDQKVPGDDSSQECVDFRGVKPQRRGTRQFEHQGVSFTTLSTRQLIFLKDAVDQSRQPVQAGKDFQAEIHFPNGGMIIRLPKPCTTVTLYLMLFSRGAVKIIAFNSEGAEVAATASPSEDQRPHAVTLTASKGAITEIQIHGGNSEAVLFKLCCEATQNEPTDHCRLFKGLKPTQKTLRSLQYNQHEFLTVDARQRLRLVDMVDLRSGTAARGSDGEAEIAFPSKGMHIRLPGPCDDIVLSLMLFSNAPVFAVAHDASGNVEDKDTLNGPQSKPLSIRLSGKDITEITLQGGAGEAVLFELCCVNDAGKDDTTCIDFSNARPVSRAVSKYEYQGVIFRSISQRRTLRTVDRVDLSVDPEEPGFDKQIELLFEEKGVRIDLPKPCQSVDVFVMLFEEEAVQGVAVDSAGNKIIQMTEEKAKIPQKLHFNGKDIRSITLEGGASEAVIYKVCCHADNAEELPQDIDTIDAEAAVVDSSDILKRLPVIKTLQNNKADSQIWRVKLGDSKKTPDGICQIVNYEPPAGTTYLEALQIVSPFGKKVSLISLCGIDKAAIDGRNTDQEVRDNQQDDIEEAGNNSPEIRREIVLEPNTEYEVVVQWSWQCWQASKEQKTPPDTSVGDDWKVADEEVYRFKTASDHTSANTPQDGLNEYLFDARDVSRYLIASEPEDGRSTSHFLNDEIWIHFDAGHIEQLLDMYGRKLQLDIYRTDPPPQSGADLSFVMRPVFLKLEYKNLAKQHQPIGYQRINDAIASLPCIPADAAVGGTSLAASTEDLIADADYDLVLTAPRANGSDKPVVYTTRFHTSRYANPRELMDDLGYRESESSPYLPDDLIIPEGMALPSGDAILDSDIELDSALALIDADTIPLPEGRPRSYVLWRFTATGEWQIEGVLIDSLESLKRERTIDSGSVPTFANRCQLDRLSISGHPALHPYRANANWTRILLTPSSPIHLSATTETELRLVFNTSDGTLQGRRRLLGVPSILEREGL